MTRSCSIIIRTKNEERWISSCLAAVFKQTYDNFEVIIVDNLSNSSRNVLDKIQKITGVESKLYEFDLRSSI